jgi:hypothetical protein
MKINPVRAVSKLLGTECRINKANELCYETCAAFKGGVDAYNVDKECAKQCEGLIEKLRIKTYGLPYCYHRGPYRPVIRDGPVFFPKLYKKLKNRELALEECNQKCEDTIYPGECREKCLLHSYAVDESEGYNSLNMPRSSVSSGQVITVIVIMAIVLIMMTYVATYSTRHR